MELGWTSCAAPAAALYFFPDGEVRSCCVSTFALGNVRDHSLADLWSGERRGQLVERLSVGDYGLGCDGCGDQISVEGRAGSYPIQFDRFAKDGPPEWPRTMGFYLSNECNLQCVQCNGESSSAIRRHRERRPPLTPAYSDAFFEELRDFVPNLDHALVVGGEPFMGRNMHRVWDVLIELAPGIDCSIVTNGTQWSDRVERILDSLRCSVAVSLDGATKETFEEIRVGADFDRVMRNLDRFESYCARVGTSLTINFCLMPQNHHEFADVLVFAEERGIHVDVSVVREPAHSAIGRQPPERIAAIHRRLLVDEPKVSKLRLNRSTWDIEVARVYAWARAREGQLELVEGNRRHTIAGFRRRRTIDGPQDPLGAERAAKRVGRGSPWARIGGGDELVEVSENLGDLLGVDPVSVLGSRAAHLETAFVDRFGRSKRWEIVERDDDAARIVAEFEGHAFDLVLEPLRDERGVADEVAIWVEERRKARSDGRMAQGAT